MAKNLKEAAAKITKSASTITLKQTSPSSINTVSSTLAFFLDDFPKTLFPLKTNKILIELGKDKIQEYIDKCLSDDNPSFSFLAQKRVYALKPKQHLRRTVKLDPVAEYYLYDVVFRNRALFRTPHTANRTHYGYRFEGGNPIPPTSAYKAFKGAIAEYSKSYSNTISLDVAAYFNGVYHHDIVSWFSELGAPEGDCEGIGRLLRQINSGRSVDCLPQGIYPTKMIGNDFLRFIDNYHEIRSEKLVRFMDDIYIFSNSEDKLSEDFQTIQRLLGEKGLSVNSQKTELGQSRHVKLDAEIDKVKAALLKRRRLMMVDGYDDDGSEIVKDVMLKWPLSESELKYIDDILKRPDIEEDDAELILTLMRDNASKVEKRLPYIIEHYPHLMKNVHNFFSGVQDKSFIANMILSYAKNKRTITEFQLFWFCATLDDHLMKTPEAASLIDVLFNHRSSTSISRAEILEIQDKRFGLQELRNYYLNSGQSDWLAWSSAVGSLSVKPAARNHLLKYFGNQSNMNYLVSTIISP